MSLPKPTSTRRSRLRTTALVLGLLLAAASATQAVVIYFKDGSKEVIADKYRIEGDRMIATLRSGQETSIPLDAVDLERTENMGKVAKGSAIVLDQKSPGEADRDPNQDRSLRDLMRDRATAPQLKTGSAAADAPAPRTARRTPAGNVDLFTAPRRPIAPPSRAEAIAALLQARSLRDADAYQGTTGSRILIDLVTASRGEVFEALKSCAAVLIELQATNPEIDALELTMATSSRSRAGQFLLTPQQAERLQSGATTPAQHFVDNVLF